MTAGEIVLRPILTEKSMNLTGGKIYTFEVDKRATKIDVKRAVKELFGVTVEKVRTMHVRGRMRRQGKHQGYTRSWKKAYVTLTPDSKGIEFFESLT